MNQVELSPDFAPLVFRVSGSPTQSPSRPEVPVINDEVKAAVRALLRHGGHKPSGRGRPASETLLKALIDDRYPQIHPLVDFFNNLSLTTGLPISVLDADQLRGEPSFRVGRPEESYLFNPSGQELKLKGLLLVEDSTGPVGTPVKDCQKTKVSDRSSNFLVVIWGTALLQDLMSRVESEVTDWASKHNLQFCQLPRG